MSEVATQAGVGKSLVLYHFSTKDELWRAVLAHKTKPFFESTSKFLEGEGDIRFGDLMREKFEVNRRDPDLPRLMAWMSLEPNMPPTPEMRERAERLRARMMDDPSAAGIPPEVDPCMFVALVLSAVDGYFRFRQIYTLMMGTSMIGTDAEDAYLEVMMKTLFRGAANGA